MHPRAAFRISFAAGLLVLAVTLFSLTQPPVQPCGNLPQNYAPIIAFELARSPADLEAIFGNEPEQWDSSCRALVVQAMDAINLVDVLVYIPVYGVFMAFFVLGMRGRDAALGTLGFRIAVIAALVLIRRRHSHGGVAIGQRLEHLLRLRAPLLAHLRPVGRLGAGQ